MEGISSNNQNSDQTDSYDRKNTESKKITGSATPDESNSNLQA
eukprot:CAMPEP_0168333716 /NCGR_PEP_ID=MMETSP0213-20121227/9782_1 /TAXON_ID=151035 /ORGANISM="Euplotes harpa, Strain FSP1.4" /LENGTH=42 /DNA_ID= /DNA_START= /DNA_END= /DNA_ORIENTATION=